MVFLLISFSHFNTFIMWNLLAIKSQIPIVKKYMHTQVLSSSACRAITHFFPLFLGNTRCIHIPGSGRAKDEILIITSKQG